MRRLEQQCFTILEVAADWHELMVPWRGMQPSTARDSGQVDPRHSTTDIPPTQSAALGLNPVAYGLRGRLVAWLSGNALVSINVVTLCRARLVLGWVTVSVCERVNHLGM